MNKILGIFVFTVFCALEMGAQKTITVEQEWQYVAPANMTLEEARLRAVEAAKLEAIANEFGTVINGLGNTSISNDNVDFSQISTSDVRGEWIRTIGEPQFDIKYWEGQLAINVKIKGEIREIEYSRPEFVIKLLRNCTDDNCESSDFRNGDRLYLTFQSSEKGYMSIYLQVGDSVYSIIPLWEEEQSSMAVKANQTYQFFYDNDNKVEMICSSASEINVFCTLFSPNQISNPLMEGVSQTGFSALSLEDFNRWLAKTRSKDKKLQVGKKFITITE